MFPIPLTFVTLLYRVCERESNNNEIRLVSDTVSGRGKNCLATVGNISWQLQECVLIQSDCRNGNYDILIGSGNEVKIICREIVFRLFPLPKQSGNEPKILEHVHTTSLGPTIMKLHGCWTRFLVSDAVLIPFCRAFCFSAFFLAPVFFFGILSRSQTYGLRTSRP